MGSATLSWYPPTQKNDGSILADLAGHRIYYGRNPARLTEQAVLYNPRLTRYLIDSLSPAR
jgi:hypothetical protein